VVVLLLACPSLANRRLMCQTPEKGLIEPPKVKTHTASLAIASAVVSGHGGLGHGWTVGL
jgi:hypothetical protein